MRMATVGSATILPAIWISSISALATVTLRICTRAFLARSLGWDDCTILLALLCSLTTALIWSLQVPYGLGLPLASISPEYRAVSAAMTWAVLFPYYIGLCLVKASALLQMLRVFAIPRVQTACLTLLALVALLAVWRSVTALIACRRPPSPGHPASSGNPIGTASCVAPFPILYINCGVNIALDVLITLLPLRVIARLRLARRRCRVLIAVFALGLIPTVPSALRLHAVTALHRAGGPASGRFVTSSASTIVWTAIDLNVAIVCACGPALGPLYTLLASRLRPVKGNEEEEDLCTMMVLSPPPSPAAMVTPLVAGSVTIVAAGVAVPSLWQRGQRQDQDGSSKLAGRDADKYVEDGIGVAITTGQRDDYDDDDALSDLVEFAGFTGLTGDASLDGFLVAAKLEKAKSREELLAVARRPSGGTTVTTTTVRVRELDAYDNYDDDDDRHELGRVSLGASEGRASSTIELV